jgi:hypothetical protein
MVKNMMVNGKMVKCMVKANWFILMEGKKKEYGKRVRKNDDII